MVAIRRTRPITACGMGPPLAALFSYSLDSHWSFFPNLALVVVFWVLSFFFSAQHTASQKRCGFDSFSIDHGYPIPGMDSGGWDRLTIFLGFHCDIFSSGSQLFEQ